MQAEEEEEEFDLELCCQSNEFPIVCHPFHSIHTLESLRILPFFPAASSGSMRFVPNLLIILLLSLVYSVSGPGASSSSTTAFHSITVPTFATFTTRRRTGSQTSKEVTQRRRREEEDDGTSGEITVKVAATPLLLPSADVSRNKRDFFANSSSAAVARDAFR